MPTPVEKKAKHQHDPKNERKLTTIEIVFENNTKKQAKRKAYQDADKCEVNGNL